MSFKIFIAASLAAMPFPALAQEANPHKRAAAIQTADAAVTTYVSALAQCESTMKQDFGGLWIMHRDIAIAALSEVHQDNNAGLQQYNGIYQSELETQNSISDFSKCPEVLEEMMQEVAVAEAKVRATHH